MIEIVYRKSHRQGDLASVCAYHHTKSISGGVYCSWNRYTDGFESN